MKKILIKTFSLLFLGIFLFTQAQFRNRDRQDRRQEQDSYQYSYGFYLNLNQFDYKLVLDPNYGMEDKKNLVQTKPTYSFGAGLIGRMRLNDNFDLRIEPGLQFVERELTFNTHNNSDALVLTDADKIRKVKSTYVDIPIMLEFHADRWYNSRPYAAAGLNYMVNVQSNSSAAEDNQQGIFRSTTHNFAWSAEAGIQFYFSRFKLTPAFRGTFAFNNEIVADNAGTPPYWTTAISTMQTRAFMFVLKFE
ncbi:porin family protein [Cloacibacterium caeni]|uniref:type IX secretion/gliding motility protein PorT/SprT n=1 Tax=Cloacibacterium caeni TaxID=2004710 RepID=UPI001BCE3249|nr:porin family protein [Cloacibacterium caeni]